MIAQASEVAMGLTGMLLVLGLIVLAVLAILMPYYVYKIAQHARELGEQVKTLSAQGSAIHAEQAKTNVLLRQLIKAYGHDPEV